MSKQGRWRGRGRRKVVKKDDNHGHPVTRNGKHESFKTTDPVLALHPLTRLAASTFQREQSSTSVNAPPPSENGPSDPQGEFLARLGLVPTTAVLMMNPSGCSSQEDNNQETAGAPKKHVPKCTRNLRKVASRSKMAIFLKANPFLSLTSKRGQEHYRRLGVKIQTDEYVPPDYEKDCRSRRTKPVRVPVDYTTAVEKKRKGRKKKTQVEKVVHFQNNDNQDHHTMAFSREERLARKVELEVGVNRKSFAKLNKVKLGIHVRIKRIPKKTVKEILQRQEEQEINQQTRFSKLLSKAFGAKVQIKDVTKCNDAIKEWGTGVKLGKHAEAYCRGDNLTVCLTDFQSDPKALSKEYRKYYYKYKTLVPVSMAKI